MNRDELHTTGAPAGAFEQTFSVQASDIDALGHVNNVVYLKWVQDVAVAHWRSAATPAQQGQLHWVVIRHEIDYLHAAQLGDGVVARTWVGTASRLKFERHTELRRAADGRVLASARTLWCPISTRTGKPTPVDDDVRARFSVAPGER
jgi:acyl-CoA thioester hydrolase